MVTVSEQYKLEQENKRFKEDIKLRSLWDKQQTKLVNEQYQKIEKIRLASRKWQLAELDEILDSQEKE